MTERPACPPPHITLDFGDGSYLFRLGLVEIAELQTLSGNVGIGAIYARVLTGRYHFDEEGRVGLGDLQPALATFGNPLEAQWFVGDLLHTIRLGLIGGAVGTVDEQEVKVSPARAKQLVETYVFPARPLEEAWKLATAILTALIVGYDGGSEKKKGEGIATATDGSTTHARSETATPSASASETRDA